MRSSSYVYARIWLSMVAVSIATVFPASPGRAQCSVTEQFEARALYGVGDLPVESAAADVDGDGVLDLMVVNYLDGSLHLLTGDAVAGVGDGTFTFDRAITLGGRPRSIVHGHFNGDAFVDFAVPLFATDEIAILIGTAGPNWLITLLPAEDEPRHITSGDFNDDGITDLAVTFSGADRMGVYLGNGSLGIGDGTFAGPDTYVAGNHPWGIAAADLNEDDITDLVVTNTFDGSTSIYPGNGLGSVGDGTFGFPTTTHTTFAAHSVIAADFDEDGFNDLAVASLDLGQVLVLRGKIGLTFDPPVAYPVGDSPAEMAVADFDQDDVLDLAVALTADAEVVVLRGNGTAGIGDGTFGAAAAFVTGAVPLGVEVGDFNQDGRPDLAVAGSDDDNVNIYINVCGAPPPPCDPLKQFRPPVAFPTGDQSIEVALADFNEDGVLDAVVANFLSGVSVMLGTEDGGVPSGGFGSRTQYEAGQGPRGVATGDFDGDDVLDFAVANLDDGTVSLFKGVGSAGVGSGSFAPQIELPVGEGARNLAAADFNGDGLDDLAVVLSNLDRVAVMLADGTGPAPFLAPVYYETEVFPYGLVVADLNQDGIADLAVSCALANAVSTLLGQGSGGVGDGTFDSAMNTYVGHILRNLASGDFDEDGNPDLAIAADGTPRVHVLRGLGDGTFDPPAAYRAGDNPENVAVADFNLDGRLDLAVGDTDQNEVLVLYGFGTGSVGDGTFSSPLAHPTGDGPSGVVAADLDGDGYAEVVTADFFGGGLSVLRNCAQMPPLPPPPPPLPPGPSPTMVGVRDVPNDEGGFVFVTWLRSSLDVEAADEIVGYRVWRRVPAAAARAEWTSLEVAVLPPGLLAIESQGSGGSTHVEFWEAIADLPAQRLPGYGFTATTPQDSLRSGNPHSAFFVTALTEDPHVFYSSEVDSGYSVDNLRPRRPRSFAADYSGSDVVLTWEPNEESDFETYVLHRSEDPDFEPSRETLMVHLTEPGYVDRTGSVADFYKLAAVDVHENMSEYAVAGPPDAVSVGARPRTLVLYGAVPNPSRDRMRVHFTLPSAQPGSIALHDLSGRLIRRIDVGGLGAGTHQVDLAEGLELPNGIYWIRLNQSGLSRSAKVALLQ